MRIKNTEIVLNFSFFLVTAFVTALDKSGTAVLSLVACMLHETGHIIMLMIFRAPPKKITLYGGGIAITDSESGKKLSRIKQITVLFSGCAVNFGLFAVCFLLFRGNPNIAVFGMVSLIIGIFNILPIGYFDGAAILLTALEGVVGTDTAHLIKNITGGVVLLAVFSAVILYCMTNAGHISLSLGITLIYLLAAQLTAGKE